MFVTTSPASSTTATAVMIWVVSAAAASTLIERRGNASRYIPDGCPAIIQSGFFAWYRALVSGMSSCLPWAAGRPAGRDGDFEWCRCGSVLGRGFAAELRPDLGHAAGAGLPVR